MQLKQANIVLGVSMTAVALVVVVAGVMIISSLQSSKDIRADRDGKRDDFKKLYARDPFPNRENIGRMGENVATVSNWCDTLLADLGEPVVFQKADDSSLFGSRREKTISDLRAAAPVGHGGAKVVGEDFMFGFDAYRDGHPAMLEDVPRLMYQLNLIESIVREMYAANVQSISSVTRETFEIRSGETESEEEEEEDSGRGNRRGGGRPAASSGSSEAIGRAASNKDGDVIGLPVPLNRQKFSFVFSAKEPSLVDLLNRLANLPRYVAVTRLEFEKTGPDFADTSTKAEESDGGRNSSARRSGYGGRSAPGGGIIAPAEPASRIGRLFSGRNLESPVTVKMDVEVYGSRAQAGNATEEGED